MADDARTTPATRLDAMASPRIVDVDALGTEQRYAAHLLAALGTEIVERADIDQRTTDRMCALLEAAEQRVVNIGRRLDEYAPVEAAASNTVEEDAR